MTLTNILRAALHGLTANVLRAALTALGVTIGVASVIATLALGNGARAAVEANFRDLGADQIRISSRAGFNNDRSSARPAGRPLSFEDGLLMAPELELVDWVEMEVTTSQRARRGATALDAIVTGATGAHLDTLARRREIVPDTHVEGRPDDEHYIGRGRFFSPAEVLAGAPVCVLGQRTALELFGGDDPLGQSIWVGRHQCEVIGLLSILTTAGPWQQQEDPNQLLLMPISAVVTRFFEEPPMLSITAHVSDETRMGEAKAEIAGFLRKRHGLEPDATGRIEDDFIMTTKDDVLGAQQAAARTFSLLLTALAVVALTVGGIGIMNVMLVSVTERTREIGIRLAVGAQRRDIIRQFVCEALLLSVVSGALGIALGILSIPLAASLNDGVALLDPASIPLAFGTALLTGVVFGIYPAVRAARLDPIEALRYE